MKKALLLCAAGIVAALGLVACGDDDEAAPVTTAAPPPTSTSATTPTAGGGPALALAADASELKYDKTALDATAGEVTIDFDNPSAVGHDVVIEDSAGEELGKTDVISQDKATLVTDLQPGTYTFFCSVDAHRPAGMEGTLTVK